MNPDLVVLKAWQDQQNTSNYFDKNFPYNNFL
jgi:hypothetical protein